MTYCESWVVASNALGPRPPRSPDVWVVVINKAGGYMSATEYVSRRCQELWIDRGEVIGQKRYPRLVRARTILARELRGEPFRLSLPEIGRELGGRHHTTI